MDEIRLEGPTPARDRATVSLRVDVEVKRKIEMIARMTNVSQQRVMDQFLVFALGQWEKQHPTKATRSRRKV